MVQKSFLLAVASLFFVSSAFGSGYVADPHFGRERVELISVTPHRSGSERLTVRTASGVEISLGTYSSAMDRSGMSRAERIQRTLFNGATLNISRCLTASFPLIPTCAGRNRVSTSQTAQMVYQCSTVHHVAGEGRATWSRQCEPEVRFDEILDSREAPTREVECRVDPVFNCRSGRSC